MLFLSSSSSVWASLAYIAEHILRKAGLFSCQIQNRRFCCCCFSIPNFVRYSPTPQTISACEMDTFLRERERERETDRQTDK